MKYSRITCLALALLALMAVMQSVGAEPIDATFTYQGKLTNLAGVPVTGSRDLQFKLFNSVTGGQQVGSTISIAGQSVADGIFTVKLNFGSSAFAGEKRWLETAVGGEVISPRAEITGSPYTTSTSGALASMGTNVTAVPPGGSLQATVNTVAQDQEGSTPQCYTVMYDNEHILRPSTLVVPWYINVAPMFPDRIRPKLSSAPIMVNSKPKSIVSFTIDDVYGDLLIPNSSSGAGHIDGIPVGQTPLEWLRQNGVAPMLAIQPDEPSRIASGRSNLNVIRTAVWAAGCDLGSHGYHAHSANTDPYRVSNDTDSKVIQTMNEELRRSHDAICELTGVNDDGEQRVLIGSCPLFVQPGQAWTGDAYIQLSDPDWIKKTQSTYGQIIRNTYEAARVYYGQAGAVWNSVYDDWYTYLEISPGETKVACMGALDACTRGVFQVGMFCHSINQDAFDVISKAVTLRDAGLLEIVSSNKARLLQFNGLTDHVMLPGGDLLGLPVGNVGDLTWYRLTNGSVAVQEINDAAIALRAYTASGSGSVSIVDEDSKRWAKLMTADAASQEQLQISIPVLRGGLQYQFQCTLKVPAVTSATLRLLERRTIEFGMTHGTLSKINGHYDDITLSPGTYRYTRSFVVPLGQRGVSLKFRLLGASGGSQIMMTDWGVL